MMPHERPADDIIDDDVEFDKWSLRFTREQATKLANLYNDNKQNSSDLTEEQKQRLVPMFGAKPNENRTTN